MEDYIRLKDLNFAYEKQCPVLQNLTLSIAENEAVGLIGCNGAGKSTLLKLLVGLLPGFSGEAAVGALAIKPENFRVIRQKLSLLMQNSDSQLFMPSVREEIAFMPRNYGWDEKKTAEGIEKIAAQLDIRQILDRPLHKLSGGEKKLAALAAVLIIKPAMLLMDEPTGGLDPKNRRRLIRLIPALPQGKIIASHDLDFIAETCGKVILLAKGNLVTTGSAKSILCDKALLEETGLELPISLQTKEYF